jgi:hypothetical protein
MNFFNNSEKLIKFIKIIGKFTIFDKIDLSFNFHQNSNDRDLKFSLNGNIIFFIIVKLSKKFDFLCYF